MGIGQGLIMRTIAGVLPQEAAFRLMDYKRAVQRTVPGVEKLILFGSRARGQARPDSDYDVAVVVRDLSDRQQIRRTLSDLAYSHILNGFYIRPVVLPSGYLDADGRTQTELAEEILRDGAEIT
jgi:predicted nucleotidyltransferase